jgi:hypothetical protein
MPHPSHLWFEHPNNMWQWGQILKFLVRFLSIFLLLPSSWVQIFSAVPNSQTNSAFLYSLP